MYVCILPNLIRLRTGNRANARDSVTISSYRTKTKWALRKVKVAFHRYSISKAAIRRNPKWITWLYAHSCVCLNLVLYSISVVIFKTVLLHCYVPTIHLNCLGCLLFKFRTTITIHLNYDDTQNNTRCYFSKELKRWNISREHFKILCIFSEDQN